MVAERETSASPAEGNTIIMGRVAGPYGVKGWLRVVSYTVPEDNLLDYAPWYLKRGGKWQATEVLEGRPHGKGLVARLRDCEDRDRALELAGTEIAICREQLPEAGPGEFYWNDLTGLRVITVNGVVLGTVDHLIETGANDVLVVKGERERLIPYVPGQVILAVDLESGDIRVDWDPEF